MAVRKLENGQWEADFYTENRSAGKRGKRVRKKFSTKGEALAFERYTLEKAQNSPWNGEKKETRRLKDIAQLWYDQHGTTLKDGQRRLDAMEWAAECMGQPLATEFNAQLFSAYRAKRLSGEFSRTKRVSKVTPRTINLELAYFRAAFNELRRLGEWQQTNPLENIRAFRTEESEMSFLTQDQITNLLVECKKSKAKDLEIIVRICLSTGARWSEAEGLQKSQISGHRITFIKTKGKKNRTVPISKNLADLLPKKKSGTLFEPCYSAFRSAIKRAEIKLPDGQLSHVLRHTFASHFMMKGGNILVLQRILGHTDIKMTMRYAHFAPSHFEDAIKYNPLSSVI